MATALQPRDARGQFAPYSTVSTVLAIHNGGTGVTVTQDPSRRASLDDLSANTVSQNDPSGPTSDLPAVIRPQRTGGPMARVQEVLCEWESALPALAHAMGDEIRAFAQSETLGSIYKGDKEAIKAAHTELLKAAAGFDIWPFFHRNCPGRVPEAMVFEDFPSFRNGVRTTERAEVTHKLVRYIYSTREDRAPRPRADVLGKVHQPATLCYHHAGYARGFRNKCLEFARLMGYQRELILLANPLITYPFTRFGIEVARELGEQSKRGQDPEAAAAQQHIRETTSIAAGVASRIGEAQGLTPDSFQAASDEEVTAFRAYLNHEKIAPTTNEKVESEFTKWRQHPDYQTWLDTLR